MTAVRLVQSLCKSCEQCRFLRDEIHSPGRAVSDILSRGSMATPSGTTAPPQCPICAGTGWKTVAIPGKSSRVARCECRIDLRAERLLKSANLPARYEHCTLSDFEIDFDGAHRSLAAARLAAG